MPRERCWWLSFASSASPPLPWQAEHAKWYESVQDFLPTPQKAAPAAAYRGAYRAQPHAAASGLSLPKPSSQHQAAYEAIANPTRWEWPPTCLSPRHLTLATSPSPLTPRHQPSPPASDLRPAQPASTAASAPLLQHRCHTTHSKRVPAISCRNQLPQSAPNHASRTTHPAPQVRFRSRSLSSP